MEKECTRCKGTKFYGDVDGFGDRHDSFCTTCYKGKVTSLTPQSMADLLISQASEFHPAISDSLVIKIALWRVEGIIMAVEDFGYWNEVRSILENKKPIIRLT